MELILCVIIFGFIALLALKENLHKTNRAGFNLILFIFIGLLIALVLYYIPNGSKYTFTLIGVTMGGAFTWISYRNIRAVFKCSDEVKGTYQGYVSYHSRSASSYTPVFKYQYNGLKFNTQSSVPCSFRLLDKEMNKGEEYTIYVDPDMPSVYVLEKRVRIRNILILIFGICCICIGLYGLTL